MQPLLRSNFQKEEHCRKTSFDKIGKNNEDKKYAEYSQLDSISFKLDKEKFSRALIHYESKYPKRSKVLKGKIASTLRK